MRGLQRQDEVAAGGGQKIRKESRGLRLVGALAFVALGGCLGANDWTGGGEGWNTDGSPEPDVGCQGPTCDEPPPEAIDARECAFLSARGEAVTVPADIVWVIDASGSMSEEAAIIQRNMNAFAEQIAGSGIDYRVVVMTSTGFVTVPAPLGTDTERFLFVEQPIGSSDALQRLVDQLPRYEHFLRDDAVAHFIVVSDDESLLRAEQFVPQMEVSLRGSFTLHAIASEAVGGECQVDGFTRPCACSGPNGVAVAPGAEHYEAAAETGGEQLSICTDDWNGLFDTLRAAVVRSAAIPCSYVLPEPPTDMIFDPGLVDVVYTDQLGTRTSLARAVGPGRCGSELAWFFDDEHSPSRIDLCPAACSAAGAGGEGLVEISLGCAPDVVLY